jgi:hypothetical protein
LPGDPELVFEPAAALFLSPRREFIPEVVNFSLRLTTDEERNRFGEPVFRPTVKLTKKEIASVNRYSGPPLSAMNSNPSSSKVAVMGETLVTFEFLKMEV